MAKERYKQLAKLIEKLGVADEADFRLIDQALTHPSYAVEGVSEQHNQRLEFVGDAVIGLIAADYLFKKYPEKSEGDLTKMRAAVVCEASLAETARTLGLGEYLLLGKGERISGGNKRTSNLADCFEALIGALYIAQGLDKTAPFVIKLLENKIYAVANGTLGDFKTELQEFVQKTADNKLTYIIVGEEGPEHEKTFTVSAVLNETELSRGKGRTKKEAEQQAAKEALQRMREGNE